MHVYRHGHELLIYSEDMKQKLATHEVTVSVNSPLVTKKKSVHYNTGEVKKCGNNIQQKKNKILLQCSKVELKQQQHLHRQME